MTDAILKIEDKLLVIELCKYIENDAVYLSRQHSLAKTPQADSWIERASSAGLPDYISRVAQELVKKGMSVSHAIASAINQMRRWIASPNTHPDTKAAAIKALAEWEALKSKSKAKTAAKKIV